jgi:acyl-CoA synthetase (AMP-forming)/AMP-acid ligase II
MIIRGGENIAPAAVERALMAIDGVVEAAVFGIPHPDLGEEVMAVVVIEREGLDVAQLEQQLRRSLASFAVPSRWRVQTDALPTNPAGKVDKPTLAAQARAEVAAVRSTAPR